MSREIALDFSQTFLAMLLRLVGTADTAGDCEKKQAQALKGAFALQLSGLIQEDVFKVEGDCSVKLQSSNKMATRLLELQARCGQEA